MIHEIAAESMKSTQNYKQMIVGGLSKTLAWALTQAQAALYSGNVAQPITCIF